MKNVNIVLAETQNGCMLLGAFQNVEKGTTYCKSLKDCVSENVKIRHYLLPILDIQ